LLAQKKVTKEKGTLLRRPCGLPCVARAAGRLPPKMTSFGARNSRTYSISGYRLGCECAVLLERPARSHSPRRLPPGRAALLGGSERGGKDIAL